MRILLAIDGSSGSEAAAAEVAAQRPWPPLTEVRIVTVDASLDPRLAHGTPFEELVQRQRVETEASLRQVAATLAERAPGLQVTTALLEGWPKEALVTEAERWRADLLVVGSHGFGPIRRFFLGSVSSYVAHNAPCSVLIVRPSTTPTKPPSAAEPPADS